MKIKELKLLNFGPFNECVVKLAPRTKNEGDVLRQIRKGDEPVALKRWKRLNSGKLYKDISASFIWTQKYFTVFWVKTPANGECSKKV